MLCPRGAIDTWTGSDCRGLNRERESRESPSGAPSLPGLRQRRQLLSEGAGAPGGLWRAISCPFGLIPVAAAPTCHPGSVRCCRSWEHSSCPLRKEALTGGSSQLSPDPTTTQLLSLCPPSSKLCDCVDLRALRPQPGGTRSGAGGLAQTRARGGSVTWAKRPEGEHDRFLWLCTKVQQRNDPEAHASVFFSGLELREVLA